MSAASGDLALSDFWWPVAILVALAVFVAYTACMPSTRQRVMDVLLVLVLFAWSSMMAYVTLRAVWP